MSQRLIFEGSQTDALLVSCTSTFEHCAYTYEYKLLVYLAKNPNRVASREQILSEVWGDEFFGTDRTVDTHIKTLRDSIKPYHYYVSTVWGFGYMFKT